MTRRWAGFESPLADGIATFLAHKRALGCRFRGEEMNLRLLDRFLVEHRIVALEDISPAVIDAFLASRLGLTPTASTICEGRSPDASNGWPHVTLSQDFPCLRSPDARHALGFHFSSMPRPRAA